jgi:isopentenyl-diphosphate delta-isomerase
MSGLDSVRLLHDSMPDLDLKEVRIESASFGIRTPTPFFVAGMTAGHPGADGVNALLARIAAKRGWVFGVGSQRRELDSPFLDPGIGGLKSRNPELVLVSNLGIAQLIEVVREHRLASLGELLKRSGAAAIAIHLNPLQECIQREGTPRFRGALRAVQALLEYAPVPVMLKETGSGMGEGFLSRIRELPLAAVDVSGLGGTHWGRVEGLREEPTSPVARLGQVFADFGIPTRDSVLNAVRAFNGKPVEIWASGGLRSGLDAAKCLALGASRVGFARPALAAALQGEEALETFMEAVENELRVAMFCTHSASVSELGSGGKWRIV